MLSADRSAVQSLRPACDVILPHSCQCRLHVSMLSMQCANLHKASGRKGYEHIYVNMESQSMFRVAFSLRWWLGGEMQGIIGQVCAVCVDMHACGPYNRCNPECQAGSGESCMFYSKVSGLVSMNVSASCISACSA